MVLDMATLAVVPKRRYLKRSLEKSYADWLTCSNSQERNYALEETSGD